MKETQLVLGYIGIAIMFVIGIMFYIAYRAKKEPEWEDEEDYSWTWVLGMFGSLIWPMFIALTIIVLAFMGVYQFINYIVNKYAKP